MSRQFLAFLILILICGTSAFAGQFIATVPATPNPSGGGTPTLFQSMSRNAQDLNSGGTLTQNSIVYYFDSTGPSVVPSGTMIIMPVLWPDAQTTGNGYGNACTSHCQATFTDSNSTALTEAFTPPACRDTSNSFNHDFFYELAGSGVTSVTETHPSKVSNVYADQVLLYNVASSSPIDGTPSCRLDQTPTNNTAPNITGTAITLGSSTSAVVVVVQDEGPASGVEFLPGAGGWNSVTADTNCTLLFSNPYAGKAGELCTPGASGSFTPHMTVNQTTTHDPFTIIAIGIKGGSGGAAPTSGAHVLLSQQFIISGAVTQTVNLPCPTSTTSLAITDDAGSNTARSDSNSDTFTKVQNASGYPLLAYKLSASISNPNTFTVTVTQTGFNRDLYTMYCMTATSVDTGLTATVGTQITTSSVWNSNTEGTGSGVCNGTAATAVNCTANPTATTGQTNDLIIQTGNSGQGPFLKSLQPSGCVMDFPGPTALSNISGNADVGSLTNGDYGGHCFIATAASQNFGTVVQQNANTATIQVTAFH